MSDMSDTTTKNDSHDSPICKSPIGAKKNEPYRKLWK